MQALTDNLLQASLTISYIDPGFRIARNGNDF